MCRMLLACKAISWPWLQIFSASFKIGAVRCCQFLAIHSLTEERGKNDCRCRGSSRRTWSLRDSSIACKKSGRNFTVSSVKSNATVSPSIWLVPNDGRGLASCISSVSFVGLHFLIWCKQTSSKKTAQHLYNVTSSQWSDSPEFSHVITFVTALILLLETRVSIVGLTNLLCYFNALISALITSAV